jgi:hypothetical protein
VFENRVLKRIFGPKRDEVSRRWRKLYNEELCHLYYLLSKDGHVERMWEKRNIL